MLKDEGLVASLEEFRHLTLAQLKLFGKAIRDEHNRADLERKLNQDIRNRQGQTRGGQLRVMGQ